MAWLAELDQVIADYVVELGDKIALEQGDYPEAISHLVEGFGQYLAYRVIDAAYTAADVWAVSRS